MACGACGVEEPLGASAAPPDAAAGDWEEEEIRDGPATVGEAGGLGRRASDPATGWGILGLKGASEAAMGAAEGAGGADEPPAGLQRVLAVDAGASAAGRRGEPCR